ncbi:hypothetical protein FB45DRAFT_919479 [Roridomyces roridus]|uniref:Uncharacterized protein n=1 Tax=Roridomyces roridus TaxID=1738132 RepID=A0AAD7FK92_9AGAR|nr:hypothetical protein FB45DRAFT_919479 [Roridomyces roridus]
MISWPAFAYPLPLVLPILLLEDCGRAASAILAMYPDLVRGAFKALFGSSRVPHAWPIARHVALLDSYDVQRVCTHERTAKDVATSREWLGAALIAHRRRSWPARLPTSRLLAMPSWIHGVPRS